MTDAAQVRAAIALARELAAKTESYPNLRMPSSVDFYVIARTAWPALATMAEQLLEERDEARRLLAEADSYIARVFDGSIDYDQVGMESRARHQARMKGAEE